MSIFWKNKTEQDIKDAELEQLEERLQAILKKKNTDDLIADVSSVRGIIPNH
jgi:hypothetical protein